MNVVEDETPIEADEAPLHFLSGECMALPTRRISEKTCAFFRYEVGRHNGHPVQIENHYTLTGARRAQKYRRQDKTFSWHGTPKQAALGGAWRWRSGGRRIVVCEGATDALAVAEAQDCKYPVVWLKNGVGASAIREISDHIQFLNGFDEIIFAFDMDEPGRTSARECAKLFEYGKAKLASLSQHDCSEVLVKDGAAQLHSQLWEAKAPEVHGVLCGEELWQAHVDRPEVVSYPFDIEVMPHLQDMTAGIRLGELWTLTSGSGMGKTTIIRQIQHHLARNTELSQCIIHMEEPLEDTVDHTLAMDLNVAPAKLRELPEPERRRAFDRLFVPLNSRGAPRLWVHDAYMDQNQDAVFDTIRALAVGYGVQVFWLDHLQMLVDGIEDGGDRNTRQDKIMRTLKALTAELRIFVGLVCHLRKAQSGAQAFEEGGKPSMADLKGAGSVYQLSNSIIAITRNQQHENPKMRGVSQLHVLKCRHTGRTGEAGHLEYNWDTGRVEYKASASAVSGDFGFESETGDDGDDCDKRY